MEYLHIVNVWSTKNSSYMKEILSNIQCHTFFLIRKWSIPYQQKWILYQTLSLLQKRWAQLNVEPSKN